MAKNVKDIATDIDGFMKKNTMTAWSLSWEQLYQVSERSRIKEAFYNDLRVALKAHALEITFGTNAVVVHRDSLFAPREYK